MTIQQAHIGRVRLTRRGMKPIYRICHVCKKAWNVSAIEPGDKHYVCPICAKKIVAFPSERKKACSI